MKKDDLVVIQKSINHWMKMIAWVKKQPEHTIISKEHMNECIHEDWSGKYCSCCIGAGLCKYCLFNIYLKCTCHKVYLEVDNRPHTRDAWLVPANMMLDNLYKIKLAVLEKQAQKPKPFPRISITLTATTPEEARVLFHINNIKDLGTLILNAPGYNIGYSKAIAKEFGTEQVISNNRVFIRETLESHGYEV